MSQKLMISASEVVEYAFSTGEYVDPSAFTDQIILSAQLRYLEPIMGSDFVDAVADGSYEELREEYIAPTLGLLSRIEAQIEAYMPTVVERERAKLFLDNLSEYLNSQEDSFAEYVAENNVLNRCKIKSGFVL